MAVPHYTFAADDPTAADVRALIDAHLSFARATSPPKDVYALDHSGLLADDITLYGVREAGRLLGIGALREIDASHAEIKSMHTAAVARGRGIGRVMLDHLLAEAARRGYRRVSLETGTMDEFIPARSMYSARGFVVCPPFAKYEASPNSVCMTLELN